jgi:VanZ family protein
VIALRAFRRPALWVGAWVAMLMGTVIVCLVPLPFEAPPIRHFDKGGHLAGYAVLSAYAAMLFATRRALVVAMFGVIVLGAVIEGLQALVPWRSMDPWDLVANTLGIALGALVALTPLRDLLQWLDRRLP